MAAFSIVCSIKHEFDLSRPAYAGLNGDQKGGNASGVPALMVQTNL